MYYNKKYYISMKNAAEYAGLKIYHINHWVHHGILNSIKIDHGVYIDPDELDAVVAFRSKMIETSPKLWPKHLQKAKENGEFIIEKILTLSEENTRLLKYKWYVTKSGVRFRAVEFHCPIRVILDNEKMLKSKECGAWLVRVVTNKTKITIIEKERFHYEMSKM